MKEEFKRIYRELQEAGGIESAKDLTGFVEMVDGFLAAFQELKERREDEEFLRGPYHLTSSIDGKTFFLKVGKDYRIEVEGPTLHAAITAARGK